MRPPPGEERVQPLHFVVVVAALASIAFVQMKKSNLANPVLETDVIL